MSRSKPKHSGKERTDHEWYVEPQWCVEAVLRTGWLGWPIYDPACGRGTVLDACAAMGKPAFGTDIIDRAGYPVWDFLNNDRHPDVPENSHIVCNPPYNRGESVIDFIEHAIRLKFQRSAFIVNESFLFSRRRMELFKSWPLLAIYFLSDRPSMPPGHLLESGEVEAKGGTANYAWLIFDPFTKRENPTCHWIGRQK